ncbi:GNAT family N-acetyltransferase [Paenibacillus arenosi]|uniref:GNAT family N-acetyltransferase n=1 Tax=Paenibacillus arenosi TaxID=2774142 RepID=UPI003B587521
MDATTAVIHDFCVLPSQQGKGFGLDMLIQMVRRLLIEQCTVIRLSVVTDNKRALQLYQHAGFTITSEFQYYVGELL